MPSPADVLRLYFVQTGVAISSSATPLAGQWPIVTGDLPSSGQDNYLAIQDSGGMLDGRTLSDSKTQVHPRVIIVVRSLQYPVGFEKGRQITTLMDLIGKPVSRGGVGTPSITISSLVWTLLSATLSIPITKIGQEEKNNRQLFTINYRLTLNSPVVSLSGLTL